MKNLKSKDGLNEIVQILQWAYNKNLQGIN